MCEFFIGLCIGYSQFTISSSSPTFSNNNINGGINSTLDGYIVGLEYNGGSTFYVNGQTADTEFINDWIHIKSEMDFSKKIVKITLTEFDLDTFCGSFENIIYTMKQKWPTSNIVFITIHKSGARDIEIQTKLHELTVAICEKWNVSVVDIFNDTKLDITDEEQMKQYMIGGKGSHPNEAACRTFYIPAIVNTLENLCEKAE